MLRWMCVLVLVLGCGVRDTPAQQARYELGRRVRQMERAWERCEDVGLRRSAAVPLNTAVQSFFRLAWSEAGRSLSEATLILERDTENKARRWADSLVMQPTTRLQEADAGEVRVRVEPYYRAGLERPEGVELLLRLDRGGVAGGDGKEDGGDSARVSLEAIPVEVGVSAGGQLLEGDYWLVGIPVVGGRRLDEWRVGVSRVSGLSERLEALEQAVAAWTAEGRAETTETATARMLTDRLRALFEGKVLETDIPAAARLREAEGVVAAVSRGERFYTGERAGDFWVVVARQGGGTTTARLFVPEGLHAEERVPLVVALHGAGGSENMFFEGYGDGKIVRLCRERGWLLVAPRAAGFGSAPVAGLIETLAERYPVDRERVLLVGHSMGAAQAVGVVGEMPERVVGVAALGGGGRVRAGVRGLSAVPFFVGVGSEDFALSGARRLREALEQARVARVDYREYEGIEHLAIVQEALSDVFGFFDGICQQVGGR